MICVKLSELDFLQGALIYEKLFTFKPTPPYSPTFEQYEMGDMNFFMNSGSMMIIIFLVFLSSMFWSICHYFALKYYEIPFFRTMGIKAENNMELKKPMTKLFIETYIDFCVSAALNIYAIYSAPTYDDFIMNFNSFSDFLSSFVTITSFFFIFSLPIYISYIISTNFHKLQSPEIL